MLHTAAAFHYVHAWSHDAAVVDTARQTAAATGMSAGGGIWFNYAFIAVWTMDAAWWWIDPASRRVRPVWMDRTVRGFLFFMFLNGAIVFAHGWVRALGVATVGLVVLGWARPRRE